MNAEQFGASGRIVPARLNDKAHGAFVPSPLPAEIAPDAELMAVLSDASYALGELAALGRAMPNPRLLINPFVRRGAVLSSRIEGTQASVADLYAFEVGQLPIPGLESTPPAADVREVANYVLAREYGLVRVNTLPVSLRLIRELH